MGKLSVHILDEGEAMNTELYVETVEEYFEDWMGGAKYLVCDFERALRSEAALLALEDLGIELVPGYPRVSQDFNAIENVWKLLRERLAVTLPVGVEKRSHFISRIHSAVAWLNRNEKRQLVYYSMNQKERCRDCLATKPRGGRTKH